MSGKGRSPNTESWASPKVMLGDPDQRCASGVVGVGTCTDLAQEQRGVERPAGESIAL